LARYEAQQKRRQLEMERQKELERQRWLHAIQYQRQQLYERNWKALRSVEFEQFLRRSVLATLRVAQ
jgi:hypothetical protein